MTIKRKVMVFPDGMVEIGCRDRRGRPSYRWVQGYTVTDGSTTIRYCTRKSAYAYAREMKEGRESSAPIISHKQVTP